MSDLTMSDFEKHVQSTMLHTAVNMNYWVLGICGEAGEIADKFKKVIRDRGGYIDEQFKEDVMLELGDVLWYIGALSVYLYGEDGLAKVAQSNIEKLQSRKARGVLSGNGDNR